MKLERRFAIIIGINDYIVKPLDCCVNDAIAVAEILKDKCHYDSKDIFLIISNDKAPLKDISGHFEAALKQISEEINNDIDSIFFYFAGHGEYHFGNSSLQFHDTFVEIADIFNRINELNPKYQCYVIDACESGGKVLSRGSSKNSFVQDYISKTSGILFMYAATENQKAIEKDKIKHGIFTFYFLNAVNDDSLYDDGVLTPNRLQDYVAKETLKESKFKQSPVIESRTIGYYPFAVKNLQPLKSDVDSKEVEIDILQDSTVITQLYFPEIPQNVRNLSSDAIRKLLDEFLNKSKIKTLIEDYEIIYGDNLDNFNSDWISDITDSIVDKSITEDIQAVDSLFSRETIKKEINPMLSSISMISAFTQKQEPKYITVNRIRWYDDRIICKTVYLKSKNIKKVSCGMSIVAYQALYGIGLAISYFYSDFDGYSYTKIKGLNTDLIGLKISAEMLSNIKIEINLGVNKFISELELSNIVRLKKILAFDEKSK